MNSEIKVLEIFLKNEPIGTITNLPGDKNLFSFNQKYINNPHRSTLSLSFKDPFGNLLTDIKSTQTRLPPFFANLLPEGYMRDYLANHARVNPTREFYLLSALGKDLPGAIRAIPMKTPYVVGEEEEEYGTEEILRFSLTGIQLKFSVLFENEVGLTIPANGSGGSWIIKLPSPTFKEVPQNEFAMMELARQIGIEVPKTALVPLEQIRGLPKDIKRFGTHAFAIKRFDRNEDGTATHMEDFAQVFGVYPEKKYRAASLRNIAEVIFSEIGLEGLTEFIRRFVFNALIGNGDMHLKNWSLLYSDGKRAKLAPAYDYVSTLPYLPEDALALNFSGSKAFSSLTLEQFKHFADKSGFPVKPLLDTVEETVARFAKVWESANTLDGNVAETISSHLQILPLWAHR